MIRMAEKYEYTITLNTAQAREVQNALEAIMRWMLKQPELMVDFLPDKLPWNKNFDAALHQRDSVKRYLRLAIDAAIPGNDGLKDDQWYMVYGIFQVIRHAIWEAESHDKSSWSIASDTPIQWGPEPLPKIEWKKVDE